MDWIAVASLVTFILSFLIWGERSRAVTVLDWVWPFVSGFLIVFVARFVGGFFGGFFEGFTKALGAPSWVSESGGLLLGMLVAVLSVIFLSWWFNKKVLKVLRKWSHG